MLSIIVAVAENNVIGKDNKLIWHLPEDLKRFKKLTTGHTIIMGRKTFESLGRILPNRKHVILCNDMEMNIEDENVEVLEDISMLDKYINSDEENFIIGGATIYRLLMPYANKLYLTLIKEEFDGDVCFPEIKENEWKVIDRKQGLKNEENPFNYEYITFERKN
ncbi:MAG: dihydrofolate reductase [Clostridiaceae bacterium]|nr:dihydrofolate reductase [Clostridiaceae bacterium]